MKDPIVEEVRRFRHLHEKLHGNNLDAIFDDICRHQTTYGHPLVRLKPKRIAIAGQVLKRKIAVR